MDAKQPLQPLAKDDKGVVRFRRNAIVGHLLEAGGIDMNDIARMDFPVEDREQFAQLIGYSLRGFGSLSYVRNDTYAAAEAVWARGMTEDQARIASLEETLTDIRAGLRAAATAAFQHTRRRPRRLSRFAVTHPTSPLTIFDAS